MRFYDYINTLICDHFIIDNKPRLSIGQMKGNNIMAFICEYTIIMLVDVKW